MINGIKLRDAFISGSHNISRHQQLVNDLNIFPVPDGDTGTNMSMTMSAACRQLAQETSSNAGQVAKTVASALLRGARGNSGVILSLLFRGFAQGLEGMEEVTGSDLANALGLGVEAAYKAVMKPTEGTILTVARIACEKGKTAAALDDNIVSVWSAVCRGAEEALENTPELLHVLKKAGVVDAGGKGLCLILEGMRSVFETGQILPMEESSSHRSQPAEEIDFFRSAAAEFDQDITFPYCTEFIIGREPSCIKTPAQLRSFLEEMGDCVVVVDDEEIIKVHLHTENPGNALQEALTYGALLTVKIENMQEQHRLAAESNGLAAAEAKRLADLEPAEPTEEIGFVAVCAGDGLKTLFTDLGCSQVVRGGQTMNPSTNEILAAVRATPAKTVLVLPNNKNVIMAADQVVPLVEDRKVIILPTRTIPQGLSAMLSYDPERSPSDNALWMMENASHVNTGLVTFAARDSEFGGHKMKEGDILGLENGKLELIEKDPVHTVVKLTRSMIRRNTSFVTLIYGEEVTEAQAEEAYNRIKTKVGNDVEVTLIHGGQPIYYFIVSVE